MLTGEVVRTIEEGCEDDDGWKTYRLRLERRQFRCGEPRNRTETLTCNSEAKNIIFCYLIHKS